jgi:HEAT repeat protein
VTRLGPFDLDGVSVLDLLLERLEAERPLLGRLLGKVRPESGDKLRAALCAAVGAIGDEGAVKVLQGLAKDQSLVVKQRAAEAVRQIKERLSR